ncbi:hypothetical protein HK096_001331, partial [Nowakowskiella sp. JEL0078]
MYFPCLLLSKTIHKIMIPIVWKEPPIRFTQQSSRSLRTTTPILTLFQKLHRLFSNATFCNFQPKYAPLTITPSVHTGCHIKHLFLPTTTVHHHPDSILSDLLALCPNLVRISLRGNPSVTDLTLSILATNRPMLRSLDISNCARVTDVGVGALHSSRLSSLALVGVATSDQSLAELFNGVCGTSLRALRLANTLVTGAGVALALVNGCCRIEVLDLTGCVGVDDCVVGKIARTCGDRLRWLSLAHVQVKMVKADGGISDESVRALATWCPNLEVLDLGYVGGVTGVSLKIIAESPMERLVSLVVTGCIGIPIEEFGQLALLRQKFGNLSTITIGDCPGINDYHISTLISPEGWLAGWKKGSGQKEPKLLNKSWDD